jgi:hypothetical protein
MYLDLNRLFVAGVGKIIEPEQISFDSQQRELNLDYQNVK